MLYGLRGGLLAGARQGAGGVEGGRGTCACSKGDGEKWGGGWGWMGGGNTAEGGGERCCTANAMDSWVGDTGLEDTPPWGWDTPSGLGACRAQKNNSAGRRYQPWTRVHRRPWTRWAAATTGVQCRRCVFTSDEKACAKLSPQQRRRRRILQQRTAAAVAAAAPPPPGGCGALSWRVRALPPPVWRGPLR